MAEPVLQRAKEPSACCRADRLPGSKSRPTRAARPSGADVADRTPSPGPAAQTAASSASTSARPHAGGHRPAVGGPRGAPAPRPRPRRRPASRQQRRRPTARVAQVAAERAGRRPDPGQLQHGGERATRPRPGRRRPCRRRGAARPGTQPGASRRPATVRRPARGGLRSQHVAGHGHGVAAVRRRCWRRPQRRPGAAGSRASAQASSSAGGGDAPARVRRRTVAGRGGRSSPGRAADRPVRPRSRGRPAAGRSWSWRRPAHRRRSGRPRRRRATRSTSQVAAPRPHRRPTGTSDRPRGQVDVGALVGHARGVDEHGEQLEARSPARPASSASSRDAVSSGASPVLVPQAGGDLHQPVVEGRSVLAHHDDLGPSGPSTTGTTATAPGERTTSRSKPLPVGPW